jgi:hypothetical protein
VNNNDEYDLTLSFLIIVGKSMDVPEKLNLCRRGEVIYLNKWGKCKVVSFRPDEEEQEEPERKGTSLLYMLVV